MTELISLRTDMHIKHSIRFTRAVHGADFGPYFYVNDVPFVSFYLLLLLFFVVVVIEN